MRPFPIMGTKIRTLKMLIHSFFFFFFRCCSTVSKTRLTPFYVQECVRPLSTHPNMRGTILSAKANIQFALPTFSLIQMHSQYHRAACAQCTCTYKQCWSMFLSSKLTGCGKFIAKVCTGLRNKDCTCFRFPPK